MEAVDLVAASTGTRRCLRSAAAWTTPRARYHLPRVSQLIVRTNSSERLDALRQPLSTGWDEPFKIVDIRSAVSKVHSIKVRCVMTHLLPDSCVGLRHGEPCYLFLLLSPLCRGARKLARLALDLVARPALSLCFNCGGILCYLGRTSISSAGVLLFSFVPGLYSTSLCRPAVLFEAAVTLVSVL